MSRHQIRIKVMQACYACTTSEDSPEHVFSMLLADTFQEVADPKSSEYDADEAAFLKELFFGTLREQHRYVQLLREHVHNWDFDRVALVDRMLIMMGIHELLTFDQIPVKVTINEYIEIAKQYSTDKSNKFVNGVLDAIHHYLDQTQQIQKRGRGLMEHPVAYDRSSGSGSA